MKSLLKQGAELILRGIFIGLGIAISIYAVFQIEGYLEEDQNLPSTREMDPNSVDVSNVRFVTFGRSPIVSFRLENKTKLNISSVLLEFQLNDKTGLFGTCTRRFDIEPEASYPAIIECNDFLSSDVPESTEAKVVIKSVRTNDE